MLGSGAGATGPVAGPVVEGEAAPTADHAAHDPHVEKDGGQ
ncbi:MAG TPA: hypothetical protein VIP05_04930 [Burkholderiaceae bacterium]